MGSLKDVLGAKDNCERCREIYKTKKRGLKRSIYYSRKRRERSSWEGRLSHAVKWKQKLS